MEVKQCTKVLVCDRNNIEVFFIWRAWLERFHFTSGLYFPSASDIIGFGFVEFAEAKDVEKPCTDHYVSINNKTVSYFKYGYFIFGVTCLCNYNFFDISI